MHDLNVPGADSEAGTGHARRHWQSGQTLVVVAVLLVVLIGFLGLVIDGGNVYAQRRQMQNAADSAALAGARALALGDDAEVEGAADEYAQLNGATNCTVFTTSTTVRAVVSKTVDTYFIRVLGIADVPVGADATAEIYPASSCPIMPLTIKYDPTKFAGFTDPDLTYTIWEPNNDHIDCSDYDDALDISTELHGWLNLCSDPDASGCTSADALKRWSCGDYETYDALPVDVDQNGNGVIEDGEGFWVPHSTGLAASVLNQIEDCNLDQEVLIPLFDKVCDCDPDATPVPPPAPTPTPTVDPHILPPCDEMDESLSCPPSRKAWYHIVAFASVRIKSIGNGDCKPIEIQWQGLVMGDECVGAGESPATNAYKVHLIE